MNQIADVTVRESHGIRRFVYPLSMLLRIPEAYRIAGLRLVGQDGQAVPLQVTPADPGRDSLLRLDFAISMGPFETLNFFLCTGPPDACVDDPLRVVEGKFIRNEQRRFVIALDRLGEIQEVVYDGLSHLRSPSSLKRNGESPVLLNTSVHADGLPISARVTAHTQYEDGCMARSDAEISAYKSWVMLRYRLEKPRTCDEIVFSLPLLASSPHPTCDFGVGGGIYGKLQEGAAPDVAWHTDFSTDLVRWSLVSAGRMDYCGTVTDRKEYLSQRWFHVIDRGKALALAITHVPDDCRTMTATLSSRGAVTISFHLGKKASAPAEFGICCHFLNDIPALSAATSPQSILQPPSVEITASAAAG